MTKRLQEIYRLVSSQEDIVLGSKAQQIKRKQRYSGPIVALTPEVRQLLEDHGFYEGSPYHKRKPNDFGLTPMANPRKGATLCDDLEILSKSAAVAIFKQACKSGPVSEYAAYKEFPKYLWTRTKSGDVFEGMYGGSREGAYHGYPLIDAGDPLRERVLQWMKRMEQGSNE